MKTENNISHRPALPRYVLTAALGLTLGSVSAQDLLTTYELALQRDPQLRAAEATRNAVLENRPQSIAKLLPTISVGAALNRNSVKSKFDTTQQTFIAGARNVGFWDSSASVNLRQPIYHHDLWVRLSQTDNQIAKAEADFAAEQQNVGLRIAQAYFNVLLAQDTLEFARAEKRANERLLEQAKARFEVGLIAITDVNSAQAGFDQATASEIKTENSLDDAWEALREIIGEGADRLASLREEIPMNTPEPGSIEEWGQRAQESNLGILSAQNEAEQAQKGIDLQVSGHLPTLDLVGSAGFTDNNRPRGISTESQVIGMQFNLPLFEGGAVNSRIRQARHQFETAQERLDQQRRAVTRQVKDAYRGVLSSISQVKALRAAVTSSQSAVEATEAGLEVGTRTMVDVLTEQRNLYRAQQEYAKSRYDYIVNSLTLKQAASILTRSDFELVNGWLKR